MQSHKVASFCKRCKIVQTNEQVYMALVRVIKHATNEKVEV